MKKYYHYTSFTNWKKIEKEGLKIYLIKKEAIHIEIRKTIELEISGIFLWKNKLQGLSHNGTIIYQMATKGDTKVVLLEIEVDEEGFYNEKKVRYNASHEGLLQELQYHNGEEGSIYLKSIPKESIKLIGVYNLEDVFINQLKGDTK